MGLSIIAEAVLRVEYKLDALLRFLKIPVAMPMHFIGHQCPGCNSPVDYVIDIQHQVVVRRCNCKTGKVPSTIPLLPLQGTTNGQASPTQDAPTSDDSNARPRPSNRRSGQTR